MTNVIETFNEEQINEKLDKDFKDEAYKTYDLKSFVPNFSNQEMQSSELPQA